MARRTYNYVPSGMGDTETYNKRMERHLARQNGTWVRKRETPQTRLADAKKATRWNDFLLDAPSKALEEELYWLNKPEPNSQDLWIIDWIRHYSIGGMYRIENLRIIRTSAQGNPIRSEENIDLLTRMIAAQRKLGNG